MHPSLLVILAEILLPSPGSLSLDDFELTANTLELFVLNRELATHCTTCGGLAERIHSKYKRVLSDLPCCGRQIRIHWTIRRFFCDAPNCSKITFTEQLPAIAQRYGRNTQRLVDKLLRVGLEAGGEAGKRLSEIWGLAVSGDQLIRLVRSSVEQEPPTPHVMGIDDWAWRKRHTYGTILVDLERRCVVDLLPDRKPETIAQWLRAHPGVEIISRDRGNEMIKGVTDGAPQAIQVADRFHLMQNLRSGLEHFLESKPTCLKVAAEKSAEEAAAVKAVPLSSEEPPPTKAIQGRRMRQEKKRQRFEVIKRMEAEGFNQRETARQLKMCVKTVRRYWAADQCPFYPEGRSRSSKIDSYFSYLEKQWQAGHHNATQLWREIQQNGFSGSRGLVARWAAQKRQRCLSEIDGSGKPMPKRTLPMASSKAAWLLLKNSDELDAKERAALARMLMEDDQVALAYTLGQTFFQMVRERQADRLNDWINQALGSKIPILKSFARGLQQDYAAVHAALHLEWSSGQTEGQVNRLKLIKREMYGRAKFDLLRKRVLGPAPYS